MNIFKLLNHILNHPLNKNNKVVALLRFIKWQINTVLNQQPVIYAYTNKSKLIVKKGMTGATQNVYCGLQDYEDMFFLLHFLREQDYFLDIGANIGSYTVLAAAHVGANVISFEPVPTTYLHLLDNISINRVTDRVSALNLAVGSQKDVLSFTNTLDTVNHVARPEEKNVIRINVDSLDNVLEGKIPTLIKIDVEGFETEVLKGANQLLEKSGLKAIIIELNGSGKRYGFNEEDIHKSLLSYGFEPYQYQPKDRSLVKLVSFGNSNTIYIRDIAFVLERLHSSEKITILNQSI